MPPASISPTLTLGLSNVIPGLPRRQVDAPGAPSEHARLHRLRRVRKTFSFAVDISADFTSPASTRVQLEKQRCGSGDVRGRHARARNGPEPVNGAGYGAGVPGGDHVDAGGDDVRLERLVLRRAA